MTALASGTLGLLVKRLGLGQGQLFFALVHNKDTAMSPRNHHELAWQQLMVSNAGCLRVMLKSSAEQFPPCNGKGVLLNDILQYTHGAGCILPVCRMTAVLWSTMAHIKGTQKKVRVFASVIHGTGVDLSTIQIRMAGLASCLPACECQALDLPLHLDTTWMSRTCPCEGSIWLLAAVSYLLATVLPLLHDMITGEQM